ncbi:DNA-3-methyladenine glycosylase family protein [Methylocaldum sp. MU1018]
MSFESSVTLNLPADFRREDILKFHRRDRLGVAERVQDGVLRKGIAWDGRPACLCIRFDRDRAEVALSIDGEPAGLDGGALLAMARRMLGLTQPIAAFEEAHRAHPQLGKLIARQRGLRVPLTATPFEALTWAITGQQISVAAAVAMRRNLIEAAGLRHVNGLFSYPDANAIAALSEEELGRAGYSKAKAQTLSLLSRLVSNGELPLNAWLTGAPPVDEIRERLSTIRGIGPWTIDYALLRGYGWLDGSLHGDAGVRRGLQGLLAMPDKITEDQARRWLTPFAPWRALVAAHLWTYSAEN